MHGSEIKPGERVKDVHFTDNTIAVDLVDGRTIVVPLTWYPKLLEASPQQRLRPFLRASRMLSRTSGGPADDQTLSSIFVRNIR